MQCPVRFCSSQGQWFTSIVDELPLQVLDGERVDGVHLQIAILLPGPPQGFPLLALFIEALDLGLVVAGGPLDIPLGTKPGIPRSIRKAMQHQRDVTWGVGRHGAARRSLATPTCRCAPGRSGGTRCGCRTRCPRRRPRQRRRRPPAAAPAGG